MRLRITKARKITAAVIGVIAGCIIGVFLCFPWNNIAEAVFSKAVMKASEKGIYLTSASTDISGLFRKTFTYKGITAELPFAQLSAREVSVTPYFSSLVSETKSAHVVLGKGKLVPITRQEINWNRGIADVQLTPASIVFDKIVFSGPITVTGSAVLDKSGKKLLKAKLNIKVPVEFDRVLNMVRLAKIVPLQKIKNGEWRIEK